METRTVMKRRDINLFPLTSPQKPRVICRYMKTRFEGEKHNRFKKQHSLASSCHDERCEPGYRNKYCRQLGDHQETERAELVRLGDWIESALVVGVVRWKTIQARFIFIRKPSEALPRTLAVGGRRAGRQAVGVRLQRQRAIFSLHLGWRCVHRLAHHASEALRREMRAGETPRRQASHQCYHHRSEYVPPRPKYGKTPSITIRATSHKPSTAAERLRTSLLLRASSEP